MPEYEVTITNTVTSHLCYTVKAANEDKAREKVEAMLEACDSVPSSIEKKTKSQFEIDDEDTDIEDISEL